MKKVTSAVILLAAALSAAQGSIVLSDSFSYPNGPLVGAPGSPWASHSGTANTMLVTNNQLIVHASRSEDVNAPLTGAPYLASDGAAALFSSFTMVVSNTLPTPIGTYFAHFRGTNINAATDFGARVWLSTSNTISFAPVPAGKFRLGIANGAAATNNSLLGQIDQDLDTNVLYTVVTRFIPSTGVSTIWLNPSADTDPSATATDQGTAAAPGPFNVFTYAFRQAAGEGIIWVDNLKIGTRFVDVAGANTAPLISSIPLQNIAGNGTTGPLNFTVNDGETVASSLNVSATSSNTVLVPNNPANLTLGGTDTNRTITVTPVVGQEGSTEITVTVSDGTNDSSIKFVVLVGVPVISSIANQVIVSNTSSSAVSFSVGDAESPASSLNLRGASSNPTLIATGGILFGGSGTNRTVTLTPQPDQTGIATITVYVDDGVNTNSTQFILSVRPLLGILFSDNFSYPDGPLWLQGSWATHASPTGTNFSQLLVTNGMAQLSRSHAEDLAANLTGGPIAISSGAVLYTGFKMLLTDLPTSGGNYFIHLKDSATGLTFRGKVFVSTAGAATNKYRVGVSVSANDPSPSYPRDLSLNQPYVVVTRYAVGTAETAIWVNPTSESSPSVAATDNLLTSDINAIGLREDTGIGTNYLDNLVISGSSFSDVIPIVAPETLQFGLVGGNLVLSWNNPLLALQSASTLTGTFTDVSNASSPYTNSLAADQQYFRLKY